MSIKRVLLLTIILVLSVCSFTFAKDESSIKVQIDGNYLDFTDEQGNKVEPQLINNRTMVPLRKIFESLDCNISWNQETKTVTAVSNNSEIKLTIDDERATTTNLETKETKEIILDSVPVIVDNRTLVPVRFIAESLNKDVEWAQDTKTVVIIDYEKLEREFKEKVPVLQKIFDLNLNSIKSYELTSDFTGIIDYVDSEEKSNNEEVKIKGTAQGKVNEKDAEIIIKASVTGKDGSIMDAVKEAGYENLNCKIIIKDGVIYIGFLNDKKKYDFQKVEDENYQSYSSMYSIANEMQFNSYEGVINMLKESATTVDTNTYNSYIAVFDMLGSILTEKSLKISENKDKITAEFNMDFGDLLAQLVPNSEENVANLLNLKANAKLVKTKDSIVSEAVKLNFGFKSQNLKETMNFAINISTKYSKVNSNITIEEPKV